MDKRWLRLTAEQKKKRSAAVTKCRSNRYKLLKQWAGGKCVVCGYSRCTRALEFHHTDPSTKKFGLAVNGTTKSWLRIITEATKCALVCANCHREIEEGIIPQPEPLGEEWKQRVLLLANHKHAVPS